MGKIIRMMPLFTDYLTIKWYYGNHYSFNLKAGFISCDVRVLHYRVDYSVGLAASIPLCRCILAESQLKNR